MSVVAPIAGASAVIPVVFGIATGDDPSRSQLAGIALRARRRRARVASSTRRARAASPPGVGLALLAAIGFGFYFPWMHAAGEVDFWWASLIFRTTALLLVAVRRRACARPNAAPERGGTLAIVLAVGLGDTLGNLLFAASSGSGLVSLTSVLASLYPIVTVLLAAAVLHERVAAAAATGIVLTLTGVVLIASEPAPPKRCQAPRERTRARPKWCQAPSRVRDNSSTWVFARLASGMIEWRHRSRGSVPPRLPS